MCKSAGWIGVLAAVAAWVLPLLVVDTVYAPVDRLILTEAVAWGLIGPVSASGWPASLPAGRIVTDSARLA